MLQDCMAYILPQLNAESIDVPDEMTVFKNKFNNYDNTRPSNAYHLSPTIIRYIIKYVLLSYRCIYLFVENAQRGYYASIAYTMADDKSPAKLLLILKLLLASVQVYGGWYLAKFYSFD